jgi:hypothetical protein
VKLTKKIQRRLCRLLSAHTDVRFAIHAYSQIVLCDNIDERYHPFLSMVICYCRPFTESRGIGSLLAEYPDFPDYPDTELNIAHKRLLTLRHDFLSHSSSVGSKVFLVFPGAVHPVTKKVVSVASFAVAKRTFDDPRYLDWLLATIKKLETRLARDIDSILGELSATVPSGTLIELATGADQWNWNSSRR